MLPAPLAPVGADDIGGDAVQPGRLFGPPLERVELLPGDAEDFLGEVIHIGRLVGHTGDHAVHEAEVTLVELAKPRAECGLAALCGVFRGGPVDGCADVVHLRRFGVVTHGLASSGTKSRTPPRCDLPPVYTFRAPSLPFRAGAGWKVTVRDAPNTAGVRVRGWTPRRSARRRVDQRPKSRCV